jgi:hypothetical protein
MAQLAIPHSSVPVLDAGGRFTREWFNFFVDLSDAMNARVAPFVADLGASPTVEQISTAFNLLLDGLQDVGLQEES